MATNTKKITEELEVPKIPGAINNNAVKTAAAGVQNAKNAVANMTYDNFKGGSLYKGLQRDYQQQGQQAMKDTLGQVAARTGGMASSYATNAANQSYNNYMKTLEDAARAMYNEEYARTRDSYDMALREYENAYGEYRDNVGDAWTRYNAERGAFESDRDYSYKVGRDEIKDERYEDAQTKEQVSTQKTDLYNLVASGGTPNRNDYPNLTDEEYSNIVSTATGKRTDDNRTNVDKEFESIFGAEGFDWNNYDWNGDGTIDDEDTSAAFDFSRSSYGEEYWQNYANEKQAGYTEETQDANTAEFKARIANGESLEDIEGDYATNGEMDWEGLTGMSKAEWTQMYNDNTISGYTYQNTEQGREGIMNVLTGSASLSLSEKDKKNFDHLYGEGAYETVRGVIENMESLQVSPGEEAKVDELYNTLFSTIPSISQDQIYAILVAANPEMFNAWADDDYFRQ